MEEVGGSIPPVCTNSNGLLVIMGARLPCKQEVGVQFPGGPPKFSVDVITPCEGDPERVKGPQARAKKFQWGRMFQGQATSFCKPRVKGSIPFVSTNMGPL